MHFRKLADKRVRDLYRHHRGPFAGNVEAACQKVASEFDFLSFDQGRCVQEHSQIHAAFQFWDGAYRDFDAAFPLIQERAEDLQCLARQADPLSGDKSALASWRRAVEEIQSEIGDDPEYRREIAELLMTAPVDRDALDEVHALVCPVFAEKLVGWKARWEASRQSTDKAGFWHSWQQHPLIQDNTLMDDEDEFGKLYPRILAAYVAQPGSSLGGEIPVIKDAAISQILAEEYGITSARAA